MFRVMHFGVNDNFLPLGGQTGDYDKYMGHSKPKYTFSGIRGGGGGGGETNFFCGTK